MSLERLKDKAKRWHEWLEIDWWYRNGCKDAWCSWSFELPKNGTLSLLFCKLWQRRTDMVSRHEPDVTSYSRAFRMLTQVPAIRTTLVNIHHCSDSTGLPSIRNWVSLVGSFTNAAFLHVIPVAVLQMWTTLRSWHSSHTNRSAILRLYKHLETPALSFSISFSCAERCISISYFS